MSSQAHNLLLDGHRGWRAKREDELDVAAEDCGSWLAGEGGGAAGPTATSPTSCARQHPDRTSAHTTDRTPGAQRSYRRAKDKRIGGCLRAQSSFGGPGDSPLLPVAVLPALPAPTPAPGQALSLPDPSVRRASLLTAGAELPPRQPPRERAALDGTRMSPCRPRLRSRSSPATPPDHRRGAVGGAGGRVFLPPLPPASSLLASLSTSCKCRVHMT